MMQVLVDTGFLVALYDRQEPMHALCLNFYDSLHADLVTCEPVVSEALHLLKHRIKAADGILRSIEEGILEVPFKLSESAVSVLELMTKYADTPADFADACLIQLANQLDMGEILTLDSDFRHYRWRRNRRFKLLIPLD